MSANQPELWIFIGPNGSGKSTLTEGMKAQSGFPDEYINADELKQKLKITDKQAQEEAWNRCASALCNHKSFAFETVGSHVSKAELMQTAKDNGYHVKLYFICTQDPEINIARVKNRVKQGGHDVPEDKILKRYQNSLALLPREFEIADEALVYNNSWEQPVILIQKDQDGNVYTNDEYAKNSKWSKTAIDRLIGANRKQISNIMASLLQHKQRSLKKD